MPGPILRVWDRVRPLLPLKAVGITAFMTTFFVAYFHLLNHPLWPVTEMPVTAIDHWIPFLPASLPAYLSLWVYVSLPPSLIVDRRELDRYGIVIGGVCLAGLACFLLWPTAVPRFPLDWQDFPGSAVLQGIDKAGNACPSLHVATAAFSAVWLHRILCQMGEGRIAKGVNMAWGIAIILSTITTRQHVFLDLVAGVALGLAGVALLAAWQRRADSGRA